MANKPLPSPEVLRQLLSYDPETGKLFWKVREPKWFKSDGHCGARRAAAIWNARYANKEAFTTISHGYPSGAIFNRRYEAHRVIWALVYGSWSEKEIDHIDGSRGNNSLINLREATSSQNKMNCGLQSNNTSGFKGVNFHSRLNRWRAYIKVNRQSKHLGYFGTREEAAAAYRVASRELHGEFARS